MGKKTQERSSAKENASCMWSFINLFEVSQSYGPHKFLVGRKLGSAKYPGSSNLGNNDLESTYKGKHEHDAKDVDVCGAMTEYSYLPSVRTLIDEEMSKERILKASGYNFNLDQKMAKNNKNDSDPLIDNSLDSAQKVLEQLTCTEAFECSNFMLNLAALIVEFSSISHHCPDIYAEADANLCTSSRSRSHKRNIRLDEPVSHLSEDSSLHDALVVEAEVFLRQKIDDAKHLVKNGGIRSQEFLDAAALEILNSNKELFPRLIQGPHSLLFEHIQELVKQRITEFSKLDGGHCLEESANFEGKLGDSGQNGKSSSNQMFQKQKLQIFSKKKGTSKGKIASKDQNTSEELSRIIVLKPHLPGNHGDSAIDRPCASVQSNYTNKLEKYSEKFVSRFSFREIKRKLKGIIGESRKEQHLMSRDGFLNRNPLGYKASADTNKMTGTKSNSKGFLSKTNSGSENTFHSSPAVRETFKKPESKEWQVNIEAEIAKANLQEMSPSFSLHGESTSTEADKSFVEEHCTDYRTVCLTNKAKPLEKMLSLLDSMYSLRFSPVKELTLSTDDKVSSPKLKLFSDTPPLEGTTGSSRDFDVKMLVINSTSEDDKLELQDENCNAELNTEGIVDIIRIENVESVQINPAEPNNILNIPAADTESSLSCERCKEELCSMPSELSTSNEKPRILVPSASVTRSSLTINDFVSSKFIIEKPERPSPVSVLEPFYVEDDESPGRPISECAEMHMPLRPTYLDKNEDSSIVITASDRLIPHQRCCSYDVEAIANNSEMLWERLPSSDPSFQSSGLDELRALSSYQEDPKLFSDYVNEAFLEMKDPRFHAYPCVSFLESTVKPIPKDLIIHEVCKDIESYLRPQLQFSLDEIMRMEMGSTVWMNLRLQVEYITAEIGCSIFEELVEETMFELFL